ncbi:MAG: hypothetical protein D6708_16470 [Candidatus Dadabacteria bacterium]|nr:MAG: hypothetical protein D6708_16470 [Candidatus Dadabacteria bacterium]
MTPRRRRWRRLKYKARGPLLYALVFVCALGLFLAALRALTVPPEEQPREPAAATQQAPFLR